MFKFFIFLPLILFSQEYSLKDKYDFGDTDAGVEYAKQLYKNKEYKKAAEIFLDISQSDKPGEAPFYMGEMLEFGRGVNQNCKLSGMFYLEAIKNRSCKPYLNFSKTYKNGGCLKVDLNKSRFMLRKYEKCIAD